MAGQGSAKTRSAREFASWPGSEHGSIKERPSKEDEVRIRACQALFYTATVDNTPKTVESSLANGIFCFGHARLVLEGRFERIHCIVSTKRACPLISVDEADRLSLKPFEQLRDLDDRLGFGLVLLGMPGLEKRHPRYPQFYSPIGFVHEFKPLTETEMRFVFTKHGETLSLRFVPDRNEDVEAMAATIRITRGNFRLIERLIAQMTRIMEINRVDALSVELVQAAMSDGKTNRTRTDNPKIHGRVVNQVFRHQVFRYLICFHTSINVEIWK